MSVISDIENILSSSTSDSSDNEFEMHESDREDDESDWDDESFDGAISEKSNESENSYNELNHIEQEYVHGDTRCREKLSEAEKATVCRSDDAINTLINKCECTKARMAESCPHGCKCSDFITRQFGLIRARNIIKQFRLKYWTHDQVNKIASIKNRRLALLRDRNTMYLHLQ